MVQAPGHRVELPEKGAGVPQSSVGKPEAAKERTERAIQDFDEAIRLRPLYPPSYQFRGFAYEALGKTKKAERDFAKAKELGYKP
ncbi:hypothetical protein M1O55_04025 [Dehalococcoidia bacterium]|nr:hypothetical protein [Dehalococcoidia bacterium]